jgi:hypothetical protein
MEFIGAPFHFCTPDLFPMSVLDLSLPMRNLKLAPVLLFISLFLGTSASAQDPSPSPSTSASQPTVDAKAEEILKHAIAAVGGDAFLNVRTVVGKGFYTTYQEGVPQLPTRFLDYIVYPDKERTEFSGGAGKIIQSNFGESGWIFDGNARTLKDMKTPQVEDFKRSMRTSVENVLRGWWRKEGASLKYIGRREAGLAMRNEVVRLTYPSGFWIEYEFGARDGMPAKILYRNTRVRADTDETVETVEEDRLQKPITIKGVTAPWVIDHFTNGFQTSRINYESIDYNLPVADSFFAKPDNIKSLK